MPKHLTVKYERSFGISGSSMRESFATTVSLEPGDTADQAMRLAIDLVNDTRLRLQRERGECTSASHR